ncbi:hypothetical protein [Halomonas aquatica]|uniref:Uncharacterized protein n=1 Tax=Halomonas aquatica TaxID=3151123 RepID=A0ABV1NCU1_9GAMM
MAMQSRLYHLKSWLTLEDAAAHLSAVLSEEVTSQDILHLALEERIKLSVLFLAPVYAIEGEVTSLMDTRVVIHPPPGSPLLFVGKEPVGKMEEKAANAFGKTLSEVISGDQEMRGWLESGELRAIPMAAQMGENTFVNWHGSVVTIDGLWDLPLLAGERFSVEELYSSQVGGEADLDVWTPNGVWIEKEGRIYSLQERLYEQGVGFKTLEELTSWDNHHRNPSKWMDMDRLPSDSRIVIRRKNLDSFIASLEEQALEQPTEGEELRALETLGLLAEALAQQHPGLYDNNGKPKRSGINSIMQGVVEEYANPANPQPINRIGLGKTTLDDTLKDAIEAWGRRKQKA